MEKGTPIVIVCFLWLGPFLTLAFMNLWYILPIVKTTNIPIQISGCDEFSFLIRIYWFIVVFFLNIRSTIIFCTYSNQDDYNRNNKIISIYVGFIGSVYCAISTVLLIHKKNMCINTVCYQLTIANSILLPILLALEYFMISQRITLNQENFGTPKIII